MEKANFVRGKETFDEPNQKPNIDAKDYLLLLKKMQIEIK